MSVINQVSTVANYVGRRVDMAAFRGIFPRANEQLLAQELVSSQDGGALIAGIEKLAQNVLMVLLKRKGSDPYRPNAGCQFLSDAEQGAWRTVADVMQSFNLSKSDISNQIQAQEVATDPDDERYGSLSLTGVILSGETVSVTLVLTSVAGNNYTFLTPITVPIK